MSVGLRNDDQLWLSFKYHEWPLIMITLIKLLQRVHTAQPAGQTIFRIGTTTCRFSQISYGAGQPLKKQETLCSTHSLVGEPGYEWKHSWFTLKAQPSMYVSKPGLPLNYRQVFPQDSFVMLSVFPPLHHQSVLSKFSQKLIMGIFNYECFHVYLVTCRQFLLLSF